MDLYDAINLIIAEGKEVEAIKILLDSLSSDSDTYYNNLLDCRARLRVIKVLNRGKDKDIENLCCEEGEQK